MNTSFLSTSTSQSGEHREYITMFNDWDLDAAFLNASQPYLSIVCEPHTPRLNRTSPTNTEKCVPHSPIHSHNGAFDEWEVINSYDSKNNSLLRLSRSSVSNSTSPKSHPDLSVNSHCTSSPTQPKTTAKSVYNLELESSKSVNIMNLDPNNGKSSLIALWSNNAADKAVSVFQKMFASFSRSNSFSQAKSGKHQQQHQRTESLNMPQLDKSATHQPQKQPADTTQKPSTTHALTQQAKPQAIPTAKRAVTEHPFNPFDMMHVEQAIKLKQPLGEAEFRNFLDSDGRVVQHEELRQRIFEGGIDPAKRKEIWPILLEIYPNPNMTYKQRNEFLKQKVNIF
jgi:hypothetical protein